MISITEKSTGRLLVTFVADSLRGARLQDAELPSAQLSGHDLSGADLRRAHLANAELVGACLVGADLGEANLRNANLRGADLTHAVLGSVNLRGADLRGAQLVGADIISILAPADFAGADLSGANLRGAHLRGVNLRGAILSDSDFTGAWCGGPEAGIEWPSGFKPDEHGAVLSYDDKAIWMRLTGTARQLIRLERWLHEAKLVSVEIFSTEVWGDELSEFVFSDVDIPDCGNESTPEDYRLAMRQWIESGSIAASRMQLGPGRSTPLSDAMQSVEHELTGLLVRIADLIRAHRE